MLGFAMRTCAGSKSGGQVRADQFEVKVHFVNHLTYNFNHAQAFETKIITPSIENDSGYLSPGVLDSTAAGALNSNSWTDDGNYVLQRAVGSLTNGSRHMRQLLIIEVNTFGVPLPDTEVFPSNVGIPFPVKAKAISSAASWDSITPKTKITQRFKKRKIRGPDEYYYLSQHISIAQLPGSTEAEANYRIYSWAYSPNAHQSGQNNAAAMRTNDIYTHLLHMKERSYGVNYYTLNARDNFGLHDRPFSAGAYASGYISRFDLSMIHPDVVFYWSK